ncbi:MAG TPA: diaminopimelate decarboxylase [Longilinea sp.]|nr:diaminopimelate decarboxylase [Longilinea sp.]
MSDIDQLFPVSVGRAANSGLTLAGLDLAELAHAWGTPLYLYDAATVRQEAGSLQDLLNAHYPGDREITYAAKAYFSLGFARKLAKMGLGVDVVSLGELFTAKKAGFQPERIHLHGNNKSEDELVSAMQYGVHAIVVDSLEELAFLEGIAGRLQNPARIWLRITPGVNVSTHPSIQTGHAGSKFGLLVQDGQAAEGIQRAKASRWLKLSGLHMHLGSQIFEAEPYREAVSRLCDLAEEMDYIPQEISPGGGWGVPYTPADQNQPLDTWVRAASGTVKTEFERRSWPLPKLILEPGRCIAARAGVAIYSVGTSKKGTNGESIVALDGGMADNPRPALYQSRYSAVKVDQPDAEPVWETSLVGKFCESGDYMIHNIGLPELKRDDLVAIPVSGAYQISMASNYNLAQRPAVLWLDGGSVEVLQAREKPEAMPYWDEAGV